MVRLRFTSLTLIAALLVFGCGKQPPAASAGAPAVADGGKTAKGAGSKGGKGGGRGGRGGGGLAQPVEVATLVRRDLQETLRVVGSVAANETATIRPEMAGLIRSVHFVEGQRVKKGELLVKIDDSELQAQLAQSESRFELAKLNLERAENLRQTQSNTQADVDRARSEFAGAQADLQLLKVRLARTDVKAPFDGTVEARTLSPGDYVNTQAAITTINDLSRLKVEFQVPEAAVAKLRRGTPFKVKPTGFDQAISAPGEVYFVNSVVDRLTRSSEVKGYLNNENSLLKAGMFAVVEIVLEVRKNALTVPEGAIVIDQRGPQLVAVREKNGESLAEFIPIAVGLRSRGLVEVRATNGELDEKTRIVAAGVGSLALFPGAKLDPRPLRAEFRIDD